MGVFHAFRIVQMVPNSAKRLIHAKRMQEKHFQFLILLKFFAITSKFLMDAALASVLGCTNYYCWYFHSFSLLLLYF